MKLHRPTVTIASLLTAAALLSAGCRSILGIDDTTTEPAAPASCDADRDGYYVDHPTCDEQRGGAPADCDDDREDVHPGAALVCGDGVVNDCAELPEAVGAAFGVQEIGVLPAVALYVGEPDAFHNNASIAAVADQSLGPTAVVTAMESAFLARVVVLDYDDPTETIRTVAPVFPADLRVANHPVEVVRLPSGPFLIASLGLQDVGSDAAYRPIFAEYATDGSELSFVAVTPPMQCPLRGEPEDRTPVVLSGLTATGDLFFEVASTDLSRLRAFHATPAGITCRDLDDVGVPYSEFGSQVIASGGLAIGQDGVDDVWTWEEPRFYNDLHPFQVSSPQTAQGAVLARNIAGGDPVLYAYHSGNARLVLEAIDCTGRTACTGMTTQTIESRAEFQPFALDLVALGTGALLVSSARSGGFDGPAQLELRFIDETGALLGGEFAIPAATIGGEDSPDDDLRHLDAVAVAPTASRPWHDILIAAAVSRTATRQPELRLIRARACNAM